MPSRTVRARLDSASEAALVVLLQEGHNESEAVRAALIEAAARRRRRGEVAAEVARVAADPDDRRARAEAQADMEAIGADWPE